MTSTAKDTSIAGSSSGGLGAVPQHDSSGFSKYAELAPKQVTMADTLDPKDVQAHWNKLYEAAKLGSGDEKKKQGLRFGVYVYGALNGTSRVGNYDTSITLFDGTSVPSAIISNILKKDIRKFFRSNMQESYHMLKETRCMENYPRFIAAAEDLGIDPKAAFAMCDWMDECPYFTPNEKSAHARSFNASLQRARRAREGRTLESVEDSSIWRRLEANGPDAAERDTAENEVKF